MNKPKISFDDYEVEPSPRVWENVAKNLPAPRRKKGWIYWTAAAVFTGILAGGYFLDIDIRLKKPKGELAVTTVSVNAMENVQAGNSSSSENRLQPGSSTTQQSGSSRSREKVTSGIQNTAGVNGIKQSLASRRQDNTSSHAGASEASIQSGVIASGEAAEFNESYTGISEVAGEDIAFSSYEKPLPSYLYAPPADIVTSKKNSAPRWQFTLLGSADYSYRNLNVTPPPSMGAAVPDIGQLADNETGLRNYSTAATGAYSFSTHFSVVTGVRYFSEGQQRDQSDVMLADGRGGSPTAEYEIVTSAGNIQGSGHEFDVAYFNNSDSTLFTLTSALMANSPKDFQLTQQFQYIGIPALIQYQPAERRFTPYIGVGFSVSYLTNVSFAINGTDVDYNYTEKPDPLLFAAEALAGIKYNVSGHFAFKVQPSMRYGLNAINDSERAQWIPYSFGLGFGITYK